MENISLINVRKLWIRHVANAGSRPDAQCYKDAVQEIFQGLSVAFCPSDDLDVTSSTENGANEHTEKADANTHKAGDSTTASNVCQPTNIHLLAQSQSASSPQAINKHALPKQSTAEEDMEMMVRDIHEDSDVNMANEDAGIENAEMQDADEQPASASEQSNGEKTDKGSVTITCSADNIESISKDASVIDSSVPSITTTNKPTHPPAFETISQPFYSTPLKPAYTQVRALYLDLLYQDRFILFNNPDLLLFLAEQPQLSHAFLQHLINHPFGIRYVHRDGSNAYHGITPFAFPFLPVDQSLPLGLYFDNRWVLLNDPAWLWRVSMEEFIMASFWAEMSFRGGLGVMQRRREATERASRFAMSPF